MLSNKNLKKLLIDLNLNIYVILLCLISIGLSIVESKVNLDAHHWGLMYSNASDLNKGLIPYKEIFIQYGLLTTLIQGIALKILGDTVVSVGIITGIFYAISIYLSYYLWKKVLGKDLASLSALIMFLIHPYIIYPWSDYFFGTFLLLSLLMLVNSKEKKINYFLAGVFWACSILSRQTTFLSTFVPLNLYFFIRYYKSNNNFKLKNIIFFYLGALSIGSIFIFYLFKQSILEMWINQNFKIPSYYLPYVGKKNKYLSLLLQLLKLIGHIITAITWLKQDIRSILYTLVFFSNLIIAGIIFIKSFRHKLSRTEQLFLLLSLITLFGYLNAIHIYDIFRLQNSSSLGIGILLYTYYRIQNLYKQRRVIFHIFIFVLIIYLSLTALFTQTTSLYNPWNRNLLFSSQLKEPENIDILKGKLYDPNIRNYYETIAKTLNDYSDKLEYLINFTPNSFIPYLSKHYKRAHILPFYSKELSKIIYPDEEKKIAQLLKESKAILVARYYEDIPKNYRIVKKLTEPYSLKLLYIAVPVELAKIDITNKNKEF